MNFSIVLVTALFFVPIILGQTLQINTPTSVVGCEPIQLAWTGGSPPYYLTFVPAGQTSATPLKQFPPQNGNTYTWIADLPSGTTFTITLRDGEGIQAFSDKVTVQAGPESSCTNSGEASSEAAPTTVADGGSSKTEGSQATMANGATSAFQTEPTVSGTAKITSNGNPQSTASSAQPSSPKVTANGKQNNASYKPKENKLQTIFSSIAVIGIALMW